MIKLSLKFWEGGPELTKLKNAAQIWFERIESWILWPVQQLDLKSCNITLLKLVAWQRGIAQFPTEPEAQFRLRVIYAYANSLDSGSDIGFMRIFARMELGAVTIIERIPGEDFDIIDLQISDTAVSENGEYLNWLIQTYGRTCRRYRFEIVSNIALTTQTCSFNCDYGTYYCQQPEA